MFHRGIRGTGSGFIGMVRLSAGGITGIIVRGIGIMMTGGIHFRRQNGTKNSVRD
jgi:hypothetical protein